MSFCGIPINDEKTLEKAAGGTGAPSLPAMYCKACGKAALFSRQVRDSGANITYLKCTNAGCSENGVEKEAFEFDTTPGKS